MATPVNFTIELSHRDLFNLCFALRNSASAAYVDGRLTTAATEHALAARLWDILGSPGNAKRHNDLAIAIDQEAIEAAVDEASEAP